MNDRRLTSTKIWNMERICWIYLSSGLPVSRVIVPAYINMKFGLIFAVWTNNHTSITILGLLLTSHVPKLLHVEG